MMANKPILFNTEMVKAILEGRKTQTRRLIKDFAGENITSILKPDGSLGKYGTKGWCGMLPDRGDGNEYCIEVRPPCEPGDILWVRETFLRCFMTRFLYKADGSAAVEQEFIKKGWVWKPSIHMPKEAARIFLRVKDVRLERLQEIKPKEVEHEGALVINNPLIREDKDTYKAVANKKMARLWDSTIKPAALSKYGWDANPWVWVIEFERCEKPEGWA